VLARTVDRGDLVEVDVDADLVNAAVSEVVATTVRMIQECLGDAPPDLSRTSVLGTDVGRRSRALERLR